MSSAMGALSRAKEMGSEDAREKSDKNGTLGGAHHAKDEKERLNAQMGEATIEGSEEEDEDDEESKLGKPNLGPRVSIKDQLEKDKVCTFCKMISKFSPFMLKFVY